MKRLLLSAAALIAAPAFAETVAFTGGTVAVGDGSAPIPGGTVVIRDGRVVAAGAGVAVPAGARVVDATGKWVSAGIVASFNTEGLYNGEDIGEGNDTSARTSPFHAAIDVSVAINPMTQAIPVDRASGVTRAIVAPDATGSIFAGQGAVIDLGADPMPVTRARAFQFVELGEAEERRGETRPGRYAQLHDALAEARDFQHSPATFDGRGKDALLTRADAAALLPVIDGRMPLVVHVERASDILQVLDLKRQYPALKLVLFGVSEGWMVAPQIAAAHVPVVTAALANLPASFEALAATESNAGRLEQAGVPVSISTVDVASEGGQRLLKQYAGNLVAITKVPGMTGLDWGHAFATITSGPAAALGMDGEIGSLRAGRRADVVVWDGDPLELSSAPVAVFIDGVQQPLTSRQTRLRDRYLNPTEGALPKAYDR
ncbi:amidohydrolase family protein [Sphingomonas nostoxanthinifaciens]|uniref:amidohydrolase family protein n=1 Tax=Sphingomonas nostoxanthinifaciens TaxID=2872652 RepID=UPI001CC21884|nr:amidohydrolase family protein [Sphingomonas nostoxanthinifaciens]UAK23359.1 amidohydrolase family protein [Sphingomonas nostoxanthinifaciens]